MTRSATMGLLALALLVPPALLPARHDRPAVGSIEGRVTLNEGPPRRSASRYRMAAVHPIQNVPAVAYLEGSIPGAPRGAGGASLVQRDTAFSPPVAFVAPGESVAFPNEDPFFHNVFSYSSSQRFDLGRYPQGQSKSVTFGELGIVKVYCEVHEFMRATVIVTPNPYHAVVRDGTFRIDGVPAGSYTLVVWHTELGEVRERVQVTEGGTLRLDLELGG